MIVEYNALWHNRYVFQNRSHVNISAASSRFPWFPGWCTYIKRRRTMEGWKSALSMCTHEDFPFRYRATWSRGWYLGMVRVARQGRHTRFYDNRRAKTPLIPEMYCTAGTNRRFLLPFTHIRSAEKCSRTKRSTSSEHAIPRTDRVSSVSDLYHLAKASWCLKGDVKTRRDEK